MKKVSTYLLFVIITTLSLCGCANVPGEHEYNKGIEAERENKLDLAQQLFEEALKKNPSIAEAHINLGVVHLKKKNAELAWQETSLGLELIEKSKKTIVVGGLWQHQAALGYNNLAKIAFNRALEANKNSDSTGRQQHYDHALSLLKKALELDPENELVLRNLSYVEKWSY